MVAAADPGGLMDRDAKAGLETVSRTPGGARSRYGRFYFSPFVPWLRFGFMFC